MTRHHDALHISPEVESRRMLRRVALLTGARTRLGVEPGSVGFVGGSDMIGPRPVARLTLHVLEGR